MQYDLWKRNLQGEIEGQNLNAPQMIELLKVRTLGEALDIIQSMTLLNMAAGPQTALTATWSALDVQFSTHDEPSELLLDDLMSGPTITTSNIKKLFEFSRNCQSALTLLQKNDPSMITLNSKRSIQTITNRLEDGFRMEWLKYMDQHIDNPSPHDFSIFA